MLSFPNRPRPAAIRDLPEQAHGDPIASAGES
jgi:hypothetical protein